MEESFYNPITCPTPMGQYLYYALCWKWKGDALTKQRWVLTHLRETKNGHRAPKPKPKNPVYLIKRH